MTVKIVTRSSVPTDQGRSSVPSDQKPRPPTEVSPSVDPFREILDSRSGFFAKDRDTISTHHSHVYKPNGMHGLGL